jgi:single-strand DNA-binding protein
MADNDNTITLVGRIGQEPELHATAKGDVLNFTLATTERRRGPDGSWTDGTTSWFRVAAWHDLARNAHASLHRGQQVIVRGVLTVNEFQVEGGGRSRNAELRATALGHDLRWGTSSYTDGGRRRATEATAAGAVQGPSPAASTGSDGGAGDWGARPEAELPRREPVPIGSTAPTGDWGPDDETPF